MPDGMIAVRPADAGSNLLHPAGGRPLPDEGGLWPNDTFTHRRVKDGGVVIMSDEEWAKRDAKPKQLPQDEAGAPGETLQASGPQPVKDAK